MKLLSRIICTTAVFFGAIAPALAEDIIVETHKLTHATVYNDRADLTKKMKVSLPKGAHNIVIKNLPVTLSQDSLRASGQAAASVVLGALSAKHAVTKDYVDQREKDIRAKIDLQEHKKAELEAEKTGLHAGRAFLDKIGQRAATRENQELNDLKLDPQSWSAASAHLTEKVTENLKASLAVDLKIAQVNDEIQKLRTELSQVRTGQKSTYEVTIPVEASAATTLDLALEYQVPNAGWRPVYDARLDTKTGDVVITQYAQVLQRTGQDWEGVTLRLSTAQPHRNANVPEIYPRWVSIYDNQPRKEMLMKAARQPMASVAMESDAAMLQDNAAGYAAAPMELREAVAQSAQIDTSGFVSEYEIKGLATVKSDGSSSKHLIGDFETDSSLEVQVLPQFSQAAYLVAQTKLLGDAPILAGQVNLFRDGAYIGKGYLPLLRAGDEQVLSFGLDDQVVVERAVLKDENSEAGLISKEKVMEKHFTTKITNTHKMPVSVVLLESIPVSQDERIRVEVVPSKTTQGYSADYQDKKGVYRWAFDVPAGAEQKVDLGWKVAWPKDQNISGL